MAFVSSKYCRLAGASMARGLHKMVVQGKMLTSISVDLDCTVINLPTYPVYHSVSLCHGIEYFKPVNPKQPSPYSAKENPGSLPVK